MSDLGDFVTAQSIAGIVRRIVTEELTKQRPVARYAVVDSIDPDTRSCMVTYVGEDTPVRVPYAGTVPAQIGQEVRIEGGRSDRVIADVRGITDTESRAKNLEDFAASLEFEAARWGLGTGEWSYPAETYSTVPIYATGGWGSFPPTPGLKVNSSGHVTVLRAGYYDVHLYADTGGDQSSNSNGVNTRMILAIWDNGDWRVARRAHTMRDISTGVRTRMDPLSIDDMMYFKAGDRFCMQMWSSPSAHKVIYANPGEQRNTGITIRSVLLGEMVERGTE